jgi:hypothetical protein
MDQVFDERTVCKSMLNFAHVVGGADTGLYAGRAVIARGARQEIASAENFTATCFS